MTISRCSELQDTADTTRDFCRTGIFPHRLRNFLPEATKPEWRTIYEDLTVQLSYPVGSPTRVAIQDAYGVTQRYMLIASTTLLIAAFASIVSSLVVTSGALC
jgi:hypothetical protein